MSSIPRMFFIVAGVVLAGLLVFFLGDKFLGSGVKEILRPISGSKDSIIFLSLPNICLATLGLNIVPPLATAET